MIQKTEVYAYLHRMEAGMLTISPKANLLNTLRIPASDVEFEVLVGEPRKIILRITEEQARFYGFKAAQPDTDKPIDPESHYRDLVRTIPDQILADEAQRRLDRMPSYEKHAYAEKASRGEATPADAYTEKRRTVSGGPNQQSILKTDSDVAVMAAKMAAKFAPDQYADESQALHTAHSESGKHSGVDYELHRGPSSILDKLPNVSRPIGETLKKIGRSFE